MTRTLNTIGILALIASILLALPALAGSANGPESATFRIDSYATETFHIDFEGGELAAVAVFGDGDTDLDLRIFDEWGNLVESDTDLTDACIAFFTPERDGTFRIEIRNLGSVYNEYVIAVN